jgi:lysophospholipase L1-like esterase
MASPTTIYLFAGNSLTEGIYGESYVERVADALHRGRMELAGQALNIGRSADTVQALLDRIDEPLREYQPQWVILAVGGNDVWLPWLSSRSLGWWFWLQYRRVRFGQRPTTDLDQFAAAYRMLIHKARQVRADVLACTASPLGEQLTWPPNRQLARLNGVIKRVADDDYVPVADVWQAFVDELALIPNPSRYVPGEWLSAWLDRRRVQRRSPDELSERRRLHLTWDGIHLNSRGADLWAHTILTTLIKAQASTIIPNALP